MCRENKECICNDECEETCKCENFCTYDENEPLIIAFQNEETGKIDQYEFLEEFEFKGEKIMAVTLIDGVGKIEFATCNEVSEISEFIIDIKLERYFAKLHENDSRYDFNYVMTVDEEGNPIFFRIIDKFEFEGKTVIAICIDDTSSDEDTKKGIDVTYIKSENEEVGYLVAEEEEIKRLKEIYIKRCNENK